MHADVLALKHSYIKTMPTLEMADVLAQRWFQLEGGVRMEEAEKRVGESENSSVIGVHF